VILDLFRRRPIRGVHRAMYPYPEVLNSFTQVTRTKIRGPLPFSGWAQGTDEIAALKASSPRWGVRVGHDADLDVWGLSSSASIRWGTVQSL
jgi:hypothetical protein